MTKPITIGKKFLITTAQIYKSDPFTILWKSEKVTEKTAGKIADKYNIALRKFALKEGMALGWLTDEKTAPTQVSTVVAISKTVAIEINKNGKFVQINADGSMYFATPEQIAKADKILRQW